MNAAHRACPVCSTEAPARGADWHLMTPPWHLTMFDRKALEAAAPRAGLRGVVWRTEGVAGDGPLWRHRAALLASRALGLGDIVRLTLAHGDPAQTARHG